MWGCGGAGSIADLSLYFGQMRRALELVRDEDGGVARALVFFALGAFALGYVLWKAGWLQECVNAGDLLNMDFLDWAEVCLPSDT